MPECRGYIWGCLNLNLSPRFFGTVVLPGCFGAPYISVSKFPETKQNPPSLTFPKAPVANYKPSLEDSHLTLTWIAITLQKQILVPHFKYQRKKLRKSKCQYPSLAQLPVHISMLFHVGVITCLGLPRSFFLWIMEYLFCFIPQCPACSLFHFFCLSFLKMAAENPFNLLLYFLLKTYPSYPSWSISSVN